MKQIGVTETYDPCFVPDLESKLLDANVIITKRLTSSLKEVLLRNKHRCLLHYTITGNGGIPLEPKVDLWLNEMDKLVNLLESGWPPDQLVLRVDPIVPFLKYSVANLYYVLHHYRLLISDEKLWTSEDPPRVRISMIDMYPHVRKRFKAAGIEVPYSTFHAPQEYFNKIEELLSEFKYNFIFESCAESRFSDEFIFKTGCVSAFDLSMMGQTDTDYELKLNGTRKGCICLVKKQILGVKPSRCPNRCLYCYWKEDNE